MVWEHLGAFNGAGLGCETLKSRYRRPLRLGRCFGVVSSTNVAINLSKTCSS